MEPHAPFPWKLLAVALAVAIPTLALAAGFILILLSFMGQDDIVIINGHVIGDTFDEAVAVVLATLFGAIGVTAVLISGRRVEEWWFERREAEGHR